MRNDPADPPADIEGLLEATALTCACIHASDIHSCKYERSQIATAHATMGRLATSKAGSVLATERRAVTDSPAKDPIERAAVLRISRTTFSLGIATDAPYKAAGWIPVRNTWIPSFLPSRVVRSRRGPNAAHREEEPGS